MNNYEEDFPFYLRFTNEKKILSEEILQLFNRFNVKRVLDIGAGNGDLSKLLVNNVEMYSAIEPKEEFVKSLRNKNIPTVKGNFPCYIDNNKYDFVLCSHSVPSIKRDYESFLNEAFKKLDKNGRLLLITYLGKENDWNDLLKTINVEPFEDVSDKYFERKDFLKKFGKLEEWFVFSKVESSSKNDLVRALSFVASGGEQEKRDNFLSKSPEIYSILDEKYYDKDSATYFFPFKHVFLMVDKE
jgi:SAM-dependent methyltransferase